MNDQLVALGRPSNDLASTKEWSPCPSFLWQSTTNHRPQKRNHHSWGVGKGSGKVFTTKLSLGEGT